MVEGKEKTGVFAGLYVKTMSQAKKSLFGLLTLSWLMWDRGCAGLSGT